MAEVNGAAIHGEVGAAGTSVEPLAWEDSPSPAGVAAVVAGAQATKPWCRYCGRRPVGRARGLCNACYQKPAIRRRFPPRLIKGGALPRYPSPPLPAEPTAALPGTVEKLEVLADRARRREQLFHPRDQRIG